MSHHPLHKFICPILGFFSLLSQPLLADATFGDFSYTVKGSAATITGFNDSTQDRVEIPARIQGIPVTAIGTLAFQRCQNLVSVSIPVGVKRIDKEAFYACGSLMKVSLPDGLTSIGETAFGYCPFLAEIDIPESVEDLGNRAFLDCARLRRVSLPSGLKIINPHTFAACVSLKEISIPSGVSRIEEGAFIGAANLTDATFFGKAPVMGSEVFAETGRNFTVYYRAGKEGFTSPTWLGYPTGIADLSPKFEVCQPARTTLVDGSARKNFGMVAVDETRTKTFTIRNTGKTRLTGLDVTMTGLDAGDFKVSIPFKTSLRVDDTTNFKVTFAPSGKGDHEAVIHVKCKGTTRNPMDIRVSGTGVK